MTLKIKAFLKLIQKVKKMQQKSVNHAKTQKSNQKCKKMKMTKAIIQWKLKVCLVLRN